MIRATRSSLSSRKAAQATRRSWTSPVMCPARCSSYSHIRMKAKGEALEAVWKKQQESPNGQGSEQRKVAQHCSPESAGAQEVEGESLQSRASGGATHRRAARKRLKRIGSSGRTRTYNPSVL
jgi:hypothetical protein